MTQLNRNRLLFVLVLVLPTAIFIGSIFYNGFSVPPLPPMPNPNGYDDLIKAATMLAPDVASYNTTNLDELQTVIATDAAALELARAGLQKKCRVPFDYNDPKLKFGTVRLPGMRHLEYGFIAEGNLAEIQGHPEQAVKSYLDMIRLANEVSRGGALIDQLVSIAIERGGTEELQRLLPQLDAKTCCETAVTLEKLDAQRQTWDDVMWQEHYWSHKAFPGIWPQIMRIMQYNSLKKTYATSKHDFETQQTITRELAIDFATRAYGLENRHPPVKVTDLATNYLRTIPIDPATGTNMVYLPK
jgi:hypothetical protein